MNGNFTTEIGRLRTEEMINRAARYQELARVERERDHGRGNAARAEGAGKARRMCFLYRRALRLGALSVLFLTVLATAALA